MEKEKKISKETKYKISRWVGPVVAGVLTYIDFYLGIGFLAGFAWGMTRSSMEIEYGIERIREQWEKPTN